MKRNVMVHNVQLLSDAGESSLDEVTAQDDYTGEYAQWKLEEIHEHLDSIRVALMALENHID